jgi:hypothetical protein
MEHVRLRRLLAEQDNLVAGWQLAAIDWNHAMIDHRVANHGWRAIHRGVWTPQPNPLTERQRWRAATLTAPRTWLNAFSAANFYEFHWSNLGYETVVRSGNAGKRKYRGLLVAHSATLDGHVDINSGIPIVSPERALIEIAASLEQRRLRRAFRESIRVRTTTAEGISKALAGQRGSGVLTALCDRYGELPYHRCNSDAESRALEVFADAHIPIPLVNVPFRGPRPDFRWHRLIIEIDSKEFHQFPDVDASYQAKWEAGGALVKRFPAGQVYTHPERLVALYRANVHFTQP